MKVIKYLDKYFYTNKKQNFDKNLLFKSNS